MIECIEVKGNRIKEVPVLFLYGGALGMVGWERNEGTVDRSAAWLNQQATAACQGSAAR
jgi:hypothetical protein